MTFALLCFMPLWVLGVSALHIRNYIIGNMVSGAGVLLCTYGLLYGGYWRIQMQKRFGLPEGRWEGAAAAVWAGVTVGGGGRRGSSSGG
jgi:hypothetical protein